MDIEGRSEKMGGVFVGTFYRRVKDPKIRGWYYRLGEPDENFPLYVGSPHGPYPTRDAARQAAAAALKER